MGSEMCIRDSYIGVFGVQAQQFIAHEAADKKRATTAFASCERDLTGFFEQRIGGVGHAGSISVVPHARRRGIQEIHHDKQLITKNPAAVFALIDGIRVPRRGLAALARAGQYRTGAKRRRSA